MMLCCQMGRRDSRSNHFKWDRREVAELNRGAHIANLTAITMHLHVHQKLQIGPAKKYATDRWCGSTRARARPPKDSCLPWNSRIQHVPSVASVPIVITNPHAAFLPFERQPMAAVQPAETWWSWPLAAQAVRGAVMATTIQGRCRG